MCAHNSVFLLHSCKFNSFAFIGRTFFNFISRTNFNKAMMRCSDLQKFAVRFCFPQTSAAVPFEPPFHYHTYGSKNVFTAGDGFAAAFE